jgi:hypothetical protein
MFASWGPITYVEIAEAVQSFELLLRDRFVRKIKYIVG